MKVNTIGKILIIERTDEIIKLYKNMLDQMVVLKSKKDLNKVIWVLTDIDEVREFVENKENFRERLSLVISESQLDSKDVIPYLKKIKAIQPQTPVYIISSEIDIRKVREAFKFGIDDWYEKPITPVEFSDIVESAFYKGESYEKVFRQLRDQIIKFNPEDQVKFFTLEYAVFQLIGMNPSRHEGHLLLAALYSKVEYQKLAEKHFKAAVSLSDNPISKEKFAHQYRVKLLF